MEKSRDKVLMWHHLKNLDRYSPLICCAKEAFVERSPFFLLFLYPSGGSEGEQIRLTLLARAAE